MSIKENFGTDKVIKGLVLDIQARNSDINSLTKKLDKLNGASEISKAAKIELEIEEKKNQNNCAWEVIVYTYQINLARFLSNKYRDINPEDIHDLVQDTFIKSFLNIDGFLHKSTFKTWLFTIAIRLSLNRLKQMDSRENITDSYDENPGEIDDFERHQTVGPDLDNPHTYDPESVAKYKITEESIEEIENALDNLPSKMKVTLYLKIFGNLTYEDIAYVMKCPVGTVRSRISRGRELMKKELEIELYFAD